jgi:hypothetical protein
MGEALHGGHKMLNHLGNMIRVTKSAIRALSLRNYMRRDHSTGLFQLRPEFYPIFKELERGNRRGGILRELGDDCSGSNVPTCHCRQCSGRVADLDHTRFSDEYHRMRTDEVIKAVKSKRHGR